MSSDFLEAAAAVGRRVVADAIWDDGRCTWVGGFEDPEKPWRAEFKALDGSVYDGTAGIGLFLAQLAAVTGVPEARDAAVGAIRHAAGHPGRREGFHAGSLGVAWAAARVAHLLDEEELYAAARRVAAEARPIPDGCPDLVFGCAGSLVSWLALAEALDDARFLDDAVAIGVMARV